MSSITLYLEPLEYLMNLMDALLQHDRPDWSHHNLLDFRLVAYRVQ
jgi:hypothetical protein